MDYIRTRDLAVASLTDIIIRLAVHSKIDFQVSSGGALQNEARCFKIQIKPVHV